MKNKKYTPFLTHLYKDIALLLLAAAGTRTASSSFIQCAFIISLVGGAVWLLADISKLAQFHYGNHRKE